MSDTENGMFSCQNICWIVGGLLGLVAFLLIMGSSLFWGLVVGIVLAVAIALVLQRLFCAATGAGVASQGAAATAAGAAAPAQASGGAAAAAEKAASDAAAADQQAAAEKAAADAAAARKLAQEQAAAEAASAKKAAAEKAAAQAAAAEKTAATKAKPGAQKGAGEGTRPEALTGPRGGKADDLKMIKGVGPKLEQLCNELGFYHFDQIANWTGAEVAWVDENLKGFKGRVSRDGWVDQAKTLASGAETEFSKRASGSGMYEE